jgi:hypothetical protein
MKIEQFAIQKTDVSTISELFIDGMFQCFILENPVRELVDKNKDGDFDDTGEGKIWGETAILQGVYTPWHRKAGKHYRRYGQNKEKYPWHFDKGCICLDPVVGFKWIMAHPGNKAKNTHGCLLPGQRYSTNYVGKSQAAYKDLYLKTFDAIAAKEASWAIQR